MGIFDSIYLANDPITSFIEVSALILLPGGPPSRPFRAAHLPVRIEASRPARTPLLNAFGQIARPFC